MTDESAARLDSPVARTLFGDRWGLVIFLGSVCGLWLFWRAGIFITDTATVLRTLQAVAEGHLWIDVVGDGHFAAPGAVVSDGLVYGRNYGQVFLSLPVFWALEGLSALADRRVGLVAVWHLLVLGVVGQLGTLFDRRRLAHVGTVVVLASFLGNLHVATSLADVPTALLALQLFGIGCAGGLAVLTYRLVGTFHHGRIARWAGGAAALVLPIGFWAQLPKRHVIGSLLVIGILYAFVRSRAATGLTRLGLDRGLVYRAGMYALVGLLAWIHAAEGVFVLLAVVAVDVPTARANDARSLAVLGVAFGLSMVPFFLTNGLIAGDVLSPPRTLPPADAAAPTDGGVLGGSGGEASGLDWLPGAAILGDLAWLASTIVAQAAASLRQFGNLEAVTGTWIRSGTLERTVGGGIPEYRAVNLAVLEVAPVFAGLVAAAASTVFVRPRAVAERVSPTDALAVAIAIAYVLLFMQRLPVHVQITVRYLLPVYPIGLYLLVRQRPIRTLLTDHADTSAWTYAGAVLIGSQLVLAAVVLAGLSVAEAAQLHALLGLAAAALVAAGVLASRRWALLNRPAAAALGAAAGLGTTLMLLSGVAYFSFIGRFVLPVFQLLADLIGRI